MERVDLDMAAPGAKEETLPLAAFGSPDAIESVRFLGNTEGALYLSDVRLVSTASAVVAEHFPTLPASIALDQNYPNPFNSGTVIRFALPAGGEVELAVYNLAGQKVATLVNGPRNAGTYTIRWDGRDDRGRTLASGVYLYRLRAGRGQQVETRKLVLMR